MSASSIPEPPVVRVVLSNGLTADVRPIIPQDRKLVAAGFQQLSMAGRIARFGMVFDHLSESELRYLTNVDQVNHVAWGARVEGEPAAIARYVLVPGASCAEVAVAVVDGYQRLGLGRALVGALVASAHHNGIERFCFAVDSANRHVLRLGGDADIDLTEEGDTIHGVISVSDLPVSDGAGEYVDLLTAVQQAQASGVS
jgi:GNAT superfamily N-acetyltransferase